jgi:glycerol-3-phosphate dehydrogenase
MTKIAVEARDRLIAEAPGLVEPLGFLLPVYEEQRPGKKTLKVGLTLYDIMARERQHRFLKANEVLNLLPILNPERLLGGFHYQDAQVDDARLVLRLINESISAGASALNYTAVTDVIRTGSGKAVGVEVTDVETGECGNMFADAIINATGCWAEKLHPSPEPGRHLRPLRGSHLVFPYEVLPLEEGFSFIHPGDSRPVFAVPWEGSVLVGTTDLDHDRNLAEVPNVSIDEVNYLMEGIRATFPSLDLRIEDCTCAFAGIRPVLSEGNLKPSEESREHVVWSDSGLITVCGGKLTTFRKLAWDALKAAKSSLPAGINIHTKDPAFAGVPQSIEERFGLSSADWRRLYGRYGASADTIVQNAAPEDLARVPGTQTLWAELPHAAQNEQIRHLDDLLLRRVRIGLLTPEGGKAYLNRVKSICQNVLPWDRARWRNEIKMYKDRWNRSYNLPQRRAKSRTARAISVIRNLKINLGRKYQLF